MKSRHHIKGRESCPFLPPSPKLIRPTETRPVRDSGDRGAYYLAALTCAQSLWLEGKPAQAILQLDHTLAVDLGADDLAIIQWPLPYRAKIWIFSHHHEEGFMGNPVRHYQHLATRVGGPRRELRSWRAWACLHLAERILPHDEYPRDARQIEREDLRVPTWETVIDALKHLGADNEAVLLEKI